MKLAELNVVTAAVRPYRKALLGKARNGHLAVRVVGDRKSWFSVAVQTGHRLVVCSKAFTYRKQADIWCERKTLQTPPTRAFALAKAA